ncbi:MAG: F0F1 ATP synthase subunit B [Dysgonamonadaceae bacterium]|jgi:F-type H+-transporting ATPase subunit b|nr:F0F1 ATP synthase subunit B [Dysgonamonadaceae bacterium]
MSLLTPDPGLLFWMLIAFGAVFFVLAKFGFPIIVKMVEERKAYIDQSLESAKQANERLKSIREEGERLLNEARDERAHILKEANEIRTKIVNEAKEQAHAEAGKIMDDALKSIEKEKALVLHDIRKQVAALAIDIAEKILRKHLENKTAQQELVDKLIAESQFN